jgi:hypothetical protein
VEFQPMSPEDMHRTMQFLLSHQAQFAADSSRVDARLEKLTGKTDQLVDALFGLTGIVGNLASQQGRTDQQLRELGDHIKTVESHLDVVIQMFERHLREGHGHRPS